MGFNERRSKELTANSFRRFFEYNVEVPKRGKVFVRTNLSPADLELLFPNPSVRQKYMRYLASISPFRPREVSDEADAGG